jgi:hypothetical protein
LAAPSDCTTEKELARQVLERLNEEIAVREEGGVLFRPLDWEDFAPGGGAPQSVIDRRVGDSDIDILLGFMWLRHGTLLPERNESGTEHEVQQSLKSWSAKGRPAIMFYFKTSVPDSMEDVDAEQYRRVRAFRSQLQQDALVQTFETKDELTKKLRQHLYRTLTALHEEESPPQIPTVIEEAGDDAEALDKKIPCRRFVHGLVTSKRFLGLSSLVNPYEALSDPEELVRLGEPPTVFLIASLPHPGFLRNSILADSPAFCCVCLAQPENYLQQVLQGVDKRVLGSLISHTPSRVRNEDKEALAVQMAQTFKSGFIAAGVFSNLVLKAGRVKPLMAYQVIIDLFLLPLLSLHMELGFQRVQLLIPDVEAENDGLLKVSKRALRAVFPESNAGDVKVVEDTSPWYIVNRFARFVDWAVGAAYRRGNRQWLDVLEAAFREA